MSVTPDIVAPATASSCERSSPHTPPAPPAPPPPPPPSPPPSPPISFVSRSSSTSDTSGTAAAPCAPLDGRARRRALYQEYSALRALALSLPVMGSATGAPSGVASGATLGAASEHKACTNAQLLRVHQLLAQLYPSSASLRPLLRSQRDAKDRLRLLRAALHDQLLAVRKLDDAANLLLLISEHVALLISCYRSSSSSGSDGAAAARGATTCGARRASCLSARREDSGCDALGICSTIPRSYKARYLRRCGVLAADALAGAVDLSSFLARQLDARGQHLLVPEIELLCRPCVSIVDLPGGFTLIFRAEVLRKMALDAERMRELALQWRRKQWLFCVKLSRNLAASRRTVQRVMLQVMQLRAAMAEHEFASALALAPAARGVARERERERAL